MKLSFYPHVTQVFEKVSLKNQDKREGAGQNAYERQQKKKDQDPEEVPVTDETVQDAINAFGADSMNQSSGLSASMEGHGPGLKVVLKDGNGGVLRSVSGEEFLKLREAIASGARSGRILDQKV